ncbi:HsdM family class I SAM-dependent methyltransferase [Nannocystis pusilla]|uniref:site-specific DNA-methyltransferase (adenine-specific) n=1 Tax=Nannocystis pusilla TaxID=889268 RepID=A0ABS7TKD4_9BACT|nr:class I SAM-dependent DNA methyltransferase [Nannocystis pusilla]MBZ5708681.1 type I restriction-modification system subunit M [Nannocystis pusilla]
MTGQRVRRDDNTLERQLWLAANKLRHHLDAAAYKHIVLGLVFLRCRPREWSKLASSRGSSDLGVKLDRALEKIERDDASLTGVLTARYKGSGLEPACLEELVALVGSVDIDGDRDLLGRIYEYFLAEFASAEGRKGGQFYTPRGVVQLLVAMLAPKAGRVYDPCCGSGGMFVHSARTRDICLFGQESNPTTWRLAKMNLALRGLQGDLGPGPGDTLRRDLHPDLRADYILANPPFNASAWGEAEPDDPRWRYGRPPPRCANFAWVQHVLHHLAPQGVAGVVLACGSLSSRRSGEGDMRRAIVEADKLDCVVALPAQLFYATSIPACLWIFAADKRGGDGRDRRGETLFIDARHLGSMVTRTMRELSRDDIDTIAGTYRTWRGERRRTGASRRGAEASSRVDVPGFARAVDLAEIARQEFVLTPGRYVGAAAEPTPTEPYAERMRRLAETLAAQLVTAAELDRKLRELVRGLGVD